MTKSAEGIACGLREFYLYLLQKVPTLPQATISATLLRSVGQVTRRTPAAFPRTGMLLNILYVHVGPMMCFLRVTPSTRNTVLFDIKVFNYFLLDFYAIEAVNM